LEKLDAYLLKLYASSNMSIAKTILVILTAVAVLLTAAVCFFPPNIINQEISQQTYTNILFVGDLMFDRGIRYYAEKNGGNEFIFEKISDFLKNYDLVVANLEGPITDEKSISVSTAPGAEKNYFFTFDKSVAETLYNQNIKIVNLGNNHILNFGSKGLEATKRYLNEAGIDYFGAPGEKTNIIKNIKGVKIGFINYNEFYENQLPVGDEIKTLKSEADIVIVYCHWGIEYQKIPSEEQIKMARWFIDNGADLVVGSHPHVTQTTEEYKGKRIYYSLGNFIFDQYFNESVRNGLGVVLKINNQTKEIYFSEIYFYLDKNGQTVLK